MPVGFKTKSLGKNEINIKMSLEPELKRRKMAHHVSGDDNFQDTSQVCGVLASKTLLRAPTASPSGDFQNCVHQFVTLVANESFNDSEQNGTQTYDIFKHPCELGDAWTQKYPIPLSSHPQRPIRTGNLYYDGIIVDLELLGYKPLQVIAKARSGTIILAQNLHMLQHFRECETVPVALKLNSGKPRKNGNSSKTDMIDEMSVHSSLHHPNIVSWISSINYHGRVGTVMEFCDNGTLDQVLKMQEARFLSEGVSRRYFQQIHSAVEYMHHQGYAHRDLCPQNVLITQNNVPKLCDFGHAVRFMAGDNLCEDECGSLGYQAPQILEKVPYNPKQADIWSLGAILYNMCTGRLPLGSIRSDAIENASKTIQFPVERILPLSKELMELARGALAYKPELRYTLNRITHSPWMAQKDTKVQIGNFFSIRQPQKINAGSLEAQIKEKMKI